MWMHLRDDVVSSIILERCDLDLVSRIAIESGAYLLYSLKFGVWLYLWMAECRIPF